MRLQANWAKTFLSELRKNITEIISVVTKLMWLKILISGLLALTISATAIASSELRTRLDQGDYAAVKADAAALHTADGYALAAEAMNAQIMLGEVDNLNQQAQLALSLAERALAIDPDHKDARLQAALADGFVTRTTGNFAAWRKKLPQKTFETVTKLHDDFPDNPRAVALLGAWHLGVVRKAGPGNAERWFGASLIDGQTLYQTAYEMAPRDILIATNYAASMIVIDPEFYGPAMLPLLESVALVPVKTHAEKKVQIRAAAIAAAATDPAQMKKLCELFLDGEWETP